MATQYTSSMASGYASNVLFYSEGGYRVISGHFSAPSVATGYFETGLRKVVSYYIHGADPTTITFSATSTSASAPPSTVAVYFSGLVTGATGYFEFRGW